MVKSRVTTTKEIDLTISKITKDFSEIVEYEIRYGSYVKQELDAKDLGEEILSIMEGKWE